MRHFHLRCALLALATALGVLTLSSCDRDCVSGCSEPDDDDSARDDDDDTTSDDDDSAALGYRDGPGREIGDEWEATPQEPRTCAVKRVHNPPGDPEAVSIAGEWNDWEPIPLDGPDDQGWWLAQLPELPPGDFAYKYLYDGEWEGTPPAWSWAKWVDNTENRALRNGNCNAPLLAQRGSDMTADGGASVTFDILTGADGADIDLASVTAQFGGTDAAVEWDSENRSLVVVAEGLSIGKHSLRLEANDTEGNPLEGSPLWLPLWVEEEGFLWNEALLYSVFLDRFRNGDHDEPQPFEPIDSVDWRANYQGGDLLGLLHAIEEGYFEGLGVNVLWLSPLQENPEGAWLARDGIHNFSGFHGYWPTDPFAIEERLGDTQMLAEERLDQVIQAAHDRGIRVMLDLVLNHVHQEHGYLSEHPEWFTPTCTCGDVGCDWEERRLDCQFMDYLPDLNHRNHDLMSRVVDDSVSLIQRLDIDGLRIDAAKHMDHVVMRRLSRIISEKVEARGGARLPLIGETFVGSDGHNEILEYVSEYELDGQFDFPLYWPIRQVFAVDQSFGILDEAVFEGNKHWGGALMSPFVGNHDVPRIATEMAGNDDGAWGNTADLLADGGTSVTQESMIQRLAMAQAFTLTQEGAPLLFYGDEIGLAGAGDPDNRRMMNFGPFLSANQQQLLTRIQAIGQARAAHKALRGGVATTLWVDDDLFIYGLQAIDGQQAIVALNKSDSGRSQDIPVGVWGMPDGDLTDALDTTRNVTVEDGSLPIELGPLDYAFLVP